MTASLFDTLAGRNRQSFHRFRTAPRVFLVYLLRNKQPESIDGGQGSPMMIPRDHRVPSLRGVAFDKLQCGCKAIVFNKWEKEREL
jgi:hypothetical protein